METQEVLSETLAKETRVIQLVALSLVDSPVWHELNACLAELIERVVGVSMEN